MKTPKSGLFFLLFMFLHISINVFCQELSEREDLLNYTDSSGNLKPVTTLYEWEFKREQILDSMQALFGKFPNDDPFHPPFNSDLPDLPPFNAVYRDTFETRFYTRYDILFTVAENEEVTAYLYIPHNQEKKRFPAIIACHPTGTLGKKIVDNQGTLHNRGYAKELAERGYVVIAPDFPGYGDQSDSRANWERYGSNFMKAIYNNIRCVDFLQARNDVDPERIGIIGHSLGGHTSIYTAAFETRLKVIVSSCGWTLNRYYNNYNETMRLKFGSRFWSHARNPNNLGYTKYKLKVEDWPFDKDEAIAVLAPRPFFSNSPIHDANFNVEGVRIGIANISRVYQFLKAEEHLQVRYPVSSHNFPPLVRYEAYEFLDKYLKDNLTENN